MADSYRTTVSLRQRDLNNLDQVAEVTALTRNDAIRQSLASEAYIQKVLQSGGKLLVEDAEGNIKEVAWVN